jgi:DNA-binding winged helix-turn-helix (wHTH) protein
LALVRWDQFELDPVARVFQRDRVPIDLPPTTFRVLAVLAAHLDQAVTREALIEAGWPGLHVVDNSLTQVIRRIRIALADSGRTPRRLVAVAKYGYSLRRTSSVARPGPAVSDPFVGRAAELEQVRTPFRGLRTVVGPQGVGKSRLVREAARTLAVSAFVDGADPVARLPARADRRVLVVDGADGLRLPRRADLAILATARQPLGVPGEEVIALDPLSEDEATELFVARAGRPVHGEAQLDELRDGLGGLPLAIELLAAPARYLPLRELVRRLRGEPGSDLDRCLAVAWSLLRSGDRAALATLAAGPAVFDLEQAAVPTPDLLGACEAAWVRFDPDDLRYHMHETLRAFVRSRAPAPAPSSG